MESGKLDRGIRGLRLLYSENLRKAGNKEEELIYKSKLEVVEQLEWFINYYKDENKNSIDLEDKSNGE